MSNLSRYLAVKISPSPRLLLDGGNFRRSADAKRERGDRLLAKGRIYAPPAPALVTEPPLALAVQLAQHHERERDRLSSTLFLSRDTQPRTLRVAPRRGALRGERERCVARCATPWQSIDGDPTNVRRHRRQSRPSDWSRSASRA